MEGRVRGWERGSSQLGVSSQFQVGSDQLSTGGYSATQSVKGWSIFLCLVGKLDHRRRVAVGTLTHTCV